MALAPPALQQWQTTPRRHRHSPTPPASRPPRPRIKPPVTRAPALQAAAPTATAPTGDPHAAKAVRHYRLPRDGSGTDNDDAPHLGDWLACWIAALQERLAAFARISLYHLTTMLLFSFLSALDFPLTALPRSRRSLLTSQVLVHLCRPHTDMASSTLRSGVDERREETPTGACAVVGVTEEPTGRLDRTGTARRPPWVVVTRSCVSKSPRQPHPPRTLAASPGVPRCRGLSSQGPEHGTGDENRVSKPAFRVNDPHRPLRHDRGAEQAPSPTLSSASSRLLACPSSGLSRQTWTRTHIPYHAATQTSTPTTSYGVLHGANPYPSGAHQTGASTTDSRRQLRYNHVFTIADGRMAYW
ncbi:hypothetical protein B0T16DRAFT_9018 [Cercophora newfieldiana]|uniref:Uncharacterized protein n=1 Tax=Cercophora newfieldiana TaxID=92897 RepID=A0AA39YMJ2_9PEZI|nr:hypothetical protein B0T16DRAFT_9018 [Cercophora newfieldiana]